MVAFIYRAEYYGLTEHPDGIDTAGLGELILAKHRHGALGTVKLRFIQRLAKFANYDTFPIQYLIGRVPGRFAAECRFHEPADDDGAVKMNEGPSGQPERTRNPRSNSRWLSP